MPPVWTVYVGLVISALAVLVAAIIGYMGWQRSKGESQQQMSEWKGSVERAIEDFDKFMETTNKNFGRIHDALRDLAVRIPAPTAGSGSPLQLTEFGEFLAISMDAYQWAEETTNSIYSSEMEDLRPFEVEDLCRNHVKADLSNEWKDKVSEFAYETGTTRDNVEIVLVILLRDKMLGMRGDYVL